MAEWYEELPEGWDWASDRPPSNAHFSFLVLADQSLFEDEEGNENEALYDRVSDELRWTSGASSVRSGGADPFVGAGGTAFQTTLEYVGYAADIIALGTFFVAVKPQAARCISDAQEGAFLRA